MRVLFIGNSHTYFNDMPFLFESFCNSELARNAGVQPTKSTMIVHGGRTLHEHVGEPEVQYNIRYGEYDYVVLQQAAHPFPGKDALLTDGGTLCGWIHASGAVPVGYMTWAEERHPDRMQRQQDMADAYTALCRQNDGILAPVGAVWQQILTDESAPVRLYYVDGEHASLAGSYLAACTLFAAITGVSPVGLPEKFLYQGKTAYALPKEQAAYVQRMAAEYLALP